MDLKGPYAKKIPKITALNPLLRRAPITAPARLTPGWDLIAHHLNNPLPDPTPIHWLASANLAFLAWVSRDGRDWHPFRDHICGQESIQRRGRPKIRPYFPDDFHLRSHHICCWHPPQRRMVPTPHRILGDGPFISPLPLLVLSTDNNATRKRKSQ